MADSYDDMAEHLLTLGPTRLSRKERAAARDYLETARRNVIPSPRQMKAVAELYDRETIEMSCAYIRDPRYGGAVPMCRLRLEGTIEDKDKSCRYAGRPHRDCPDYATTEEDDD